MPRWASIWSWLAIDRERHARAAQGLDLVVAEVAAEGAVRRLRPDELGHDERERDGRDHDGREDGHPDAGALA